MNKLVAAVAVAAFTLSACGGGGGGGRPSTDEIAQALEKSTNDSGFSTADMPDGAIDCIAKLYHDSDLSDEALRAIVDGDTDYEGSDADTAAIQDMQDELGACATQS